MTTPSDPATLWALAADMEQRVVILREHQAAVVSEAITGAAFDEPIAVFTSVATALREAAASLEAAEFTRRDLMSQAYIAATQRAEAQTETRMFAKAADTEKAEAQHWRARAEAAEALCATVTAEIEQVRHLRTVELRMWIVTRDAWEAECATLRREHQHWLVEAAERVKAAEASRDDALRQIEMQDGVIQQLGRELAARAPQEQT